MLATISDVRAFVHAHGVVLQSARGPAQSLVEAIVGAPVRGSWWGHPEGGRVFALLSELAEDPDVMACRLVRGKVTLVHRRLWAALARLAPGLPPERSARVVEEHTATGRHRTRSIPFPNWVPADVLAASARLSDAEARAALGPEVLS